jgi:hypothetical protein
MRHVISTCRYFCYMQNALLIQKGVATDDAAGAAAATLVIAPQFYACNANDDDSAYCDTDDFEAHVALDPDSELYWE